MTSAKPDGSRSEADSLSDARARLARGRSDLCGADIAKGLEDGEFRLLYQPIVSADAHRLICVEALARWVHGDGQTVMPDVFIPLAERSGMIPALGLWVLREACAQALRWPGVRLAVNMSPLQLQDATFVESVRDVLAETGFPAALLELELTEAVALGDAVNVRNDMAALRRQGVRLALDDFGTGYSGLIYLRRLPIDKIKIDREFMHALSDSADASILVRSMVQLGRDLGITVTAEGVESVEVQAILAEAGCDELQGYLFARPLPASEIDGIVARQNAGELLYATKPPGP